MDRHTANTRRREAAYERSERARWAAEGECTACGRTGRLRLPRDADGPGDGTIYLTHWHKHPQTRRDCRSEVDLSQVRWVDRWRLQECGLPLDGLIRWTVDGREYGGWVQAKPVVLSGAVQMVEAATGDAVHYIGAKELVPTWALRRCVARRCLNTLNFAACMDSALGDPQDGWQQICGVLGGEVVCPEHADPALRHHPVRWVKQEPVTLVCSCGVPIRPVGGETRGDFIAAYGLHLARWRAVESGL